MRFNRFIFDNYLQTNEGKEALKFFTDFWTYFKNNDVDTIYNFIQKQYLREIEKNGVTNFIRFVNELTIERNTDEGAETLQKVRDKIVSIESAMDYFDEYIRGIIKDNPEIKFRRLCAVIESISLNLYFIKPEYYFPYFFFGSFLYSRINIL